MNNPRDELLVKIADYTANYRTPSKEAWKVARLCLADAMGCALLALNFEECKKVLGPWVEGTIVPHGCHIPGTDYILDPVQGAFNFGAMVRWLDFNDTFLAAEWAHPSDNIGGLLPLLDYLSQNGRTEGRQIFTVRDLLLAIIKAYEIQGGLALKNSFNRVGLDHVVFIKAATAAVATELLGGNADQIADALSQVFIDIGPLRLYRHAPNTGPRKSWAAADATSRGIQFALLTMRGERGYRTPLSAPKWGLSDVFFYGHPLVIDQPLGNYIVENILFKISFPAEFHAQTAVEAAMHLHPSVKDRLDAIERIDIATHESALRIIDKKGPLTNHADRDHCMQYMVAIALINGVLTAEHYTDAAAEDPRIDVLREKMHLTEEPRFSRDYLDPNIRSIASALTITMKDGKRLGPIAVEFPIGHKRRREEAIPLLFTKMEHNLKTRLPAARVQEILELFQSPEKLDATPIPKFIDYFL